VTVGSGAVLVVLGAFMDGASELLHPPDIGHCVQLPGLPALRRGLWVDWAVAPAGDTDLPVAFVDDYLLTGVDLRISLAERAVMAQTGAGVGPISDIVVLPAIRTHITTRKNHVTA